MKFSDKINKIDNNKISFHVPTREDFPFLIKQMGYKRICEIGVHQGYFLYILAKSEPELLVGIDVWDKYEAWAYEEIPVYYEYYKPHNKKSREDVHEWASNQPCNVDLIVNLSSVAVDMFDDEYFDFVYIDADHSYEGASRDLELWYPKVRKGGMIAGHDYLNCYVESPIDPEVGMYFGAKDAVDHFVEKYHKEDSFFLTNEKNKIYPKSFFIIK